MAPKPVRCYNSAGQWPATVMMSLNYQFSTLNPLNVHHVWYTKHYEVQSNLREEKVVRSTYQIKSLQWLQNVGVLKNLGTNLWFLTMNTFFCLTAPLLWNLFSDGFCKDALLSVLDILLRDILLIPTLQLLKHQPPATHLLLWVSETALNLISIQLSSCNLSEVSSFYI